MILFQRYIFRRALTFTLGTLAAITLIALSTQVLQRLNLVTQKGQTILTFLELSAYFIPSMALAMLPFAVLLGGLRVLSNMNADSELAVLEAAGGSPALIARPLVALGLLMSLLSLAGSVWVQPYAARSMRVLLSQAGQDLIALAMTTGEFQQVERGVFVQVAEELPGGTLGGVVIVDGRNPKTDLIYYAKRGAVRRVGATSVLILQDGEVHRSAKSGGQVSVISFMTTAFDLSTLRSGSDKMRFGASERWTGELLHPDLADPDVQRDPGGFKEEFHRRLSDWLYPLAFSLLAAWFAGTARTHRDQNWAMVALGCLAALGLRGAGLVASQSAGESAAAAVGVYALPIGAAALFAGLIASGRMAPRQSAWSQTLVEWAQRLPLQGRRLAGGPPSESPSGSR